MYTTDPIIACIQARSLLTTSTPIPLSKIKLNYTKLGRENGRTRRRNERKMLIIIQLKSNTKITKSYKSIKMLNSISMGLQLIVFQ